MKIILHRGRYNGDIGLDNNPDHIISLINKGFDVEIDLWVENNKLYLGHDAPTYNIGFTTLHSWCENAWIHCKNFQALHFCLRHRYLNSFWHDEDKYTLTSHGYIWTYPGVETTLISNDQIALDFSKDIDIEKYRIAGYYGVCLDYYNVENI